MTVVDASVAVDALVADGAAGDRARNELRSFDAVAVPAVFPAEVTSALRSLVLRGELAAGRAATARGRLAGLRIVLFPFEPFADRVWELRDTITTYDAWYVALAETLGVDLVTADARLARAAGPRCPVRAPHAGR